MNVKIEYVLRAQFVCFLVCSVFVCVYVYTGLSSFSSCCILFSFSHFGVFLCFWASLSCLFGCSCVPSPLANTHDPVRVLLLPFCFFHFLFVLLVVSTSTSSVFGR